MSTEKTIWEKLAEPTPREEIKWREGPKGRMLAYVDARWVMDRLDTVCGPANWQARYDWSDGKRICCSIGIRLFDPEHGTDEWIWKANGAGETDIEGEKGAFSDAFKRAAVLFGIARDLYHLQPPKAPETPIADRMAQVQAQARSQAQKPPAAKAAEPEKLPGVLKSTITGTAQRQGKSGVAFYEILLPDGRKMSTFDDKQYQLAQDAAELDIPCVIKYIQKGQYLNIVSITPMEEQP